MQPIPPWFFLHTTCFTVKALQTESFFAAPVGAAIAVFIALRFLRPAEASGIRIAFAVGTIDSSVTVIVNAVGATFCRWRATVGRTTARVLARVAG